ncbi:hypothetical protein KP509_30G035600 [Ceratopteris richardii]|uniref:Methyltransferase small domain-containing protein n=3 Tax=Ceratopteris richardii TaxID=49495 RepID=A0A8T2R1I0_CERRI|nr:hypothetical protein KP509_30G035600 [Ceratopteris richardii]
MGYLSAHKLDFQSFINALRLVRWFPASQASLILFLFGMDVAFNEENEDPVTKTHDPFATRSSAGLRLLARHPEVYGPSDDSFVLVDALLAEKAHLRELHPRLCVEVGCGSGYVITSLALMLGNGKENIKYIASDISEAALKATAITLKAHGLCAELYKVDLISGLEKRLAGAVDVLIFNPPCVPTLDEEVGTSAWAGGNKGRVVIDRMLKTVDSILSKKGRFYLVTVTANNPGEICQIMRRKGFSSRIVIQRHSEEESLHVLKFWREKLDHSSGSDKSLLYSRCASALHVSLSHRLSRLVSFK